MESAACEEEDLEDLGWGGGALRKRPMGKGSCGGEKKFKKRTDMFLKGLGKVWLYKVDALLPSS